MVAGREFSDAVEDRDGIVVNQTFAATLWPNEDPVGKAVAYGPGNPRGKTCHRCGRV
jgi:hypothetical protein